MAEFKSLKDEGDAGERLVAEYLIRNGYTILEKQWRPSRQSKLEIDIIAMKDMTIVFVEVKTRNGKHGDPVDAVDHRKITNICRAADSYLRQQPYMYEYRFDIAGVMDISSSNPKLEYIEDAFMPPLANR